tara:strand:+ start:496 stop:699 length:204 start_codon:yes stop_codon:yes gene_type:complete
MFGDRVHMLMTADQLPTLLTRVAKIIKYHEDLEEEHTENMRHDAETGRDDDDDLESDVHEEREDNDE